MKKVVAVMALAVFFAGQLSCGAKEGAAVKPEMKTFMEQYSYMIGLDIGRTLKGMNTEVNENAIMWGIQDIIKNRSQLLTPKALDSIKQEFSTIMQQKQMSLMKEVGGKNLQEGQAFLAANKTKPGVMTTASGLQYQVMTQGSGPKPKATDKVKVNYVGTLLDGKEFDSSIKRGQPAVFPLNGIIPAWSEGLQLMNVGSKYKLFVPPNLAYGERGAGQDIGPNSVLIFEVELLGIEK
jgi:FKBP-type peptidyl-prolyl cis-trans isomerase FkpA